MTALEHQQSLFADESPSSQLRGPVECLGVSFESDEARRAYFLAKLREKLQDPDFRKIEGFPIGTDEDILTLSDPPYYTPCPNPFIEDFVAFYSKPYDPAVLYHCEPYTGALRAEERHPVGSILIPVIRGNGWFCGICDCIWVRDETALGLVRRQLEINRTVEEWQKVGRAPLFHGSDTDPSRGWQTTLPGGISSKE